MKQYIFECDECGNSFQSVGMPRFCLPCHFKNYNPKTGKYDLNTEPLNYQKRQLSKINLVA